MDDIFGADEPTVELLILADHVEVVHGKLYMMGGGWENITVHDFESPVTLNLAVSVLVPWNATNRQHTISVAVQDADAETVANVEGNIVAGRPAHIEHGSTQRSMMSMILPVLFPAPGTYVITASVNEEIGKRLTFRAIAAHSHTH